MIRKFQAADLDAVARIWLQTNREAHGFVPDHFWQDQLADVKREFLAADLYVAEEDGKIAGFIGLEGDEVAGLFVAASCQSRGLGKQLLDQAKSERPQLYLRVYEQNPRALEFYEREDFKFQGEETDPYTGEPEYALFWQRDC
ncbi:GNAT family N-acetyltransferase [Lactobacillus porci]|uniref:GNAT family N-acetyltransferase n=1 Tax=Lactobacillus porci TaxID=2012477 RepID=A0A6A8MET4_9LACO|nr:GNAT family N-acetyltransferase [Lactobacillus porci]MST87216.1 GNAT family N-acetyltransferase [Lactobacillus porci]